MTRGDAWVRPFLPSRSALCFIDFPSILVFMLVFGCSLFGRRCRFLFDFVFWERAMLLRVDSRRIFVRFICVNLRFAQSDLVC